MSAKRLLILEDDIEVARCISLQAEALGFEVKIVEEPESFMQEKHMWHPSHIALDLLMPLINSVAFLETLASAQCRASIILTSGIGSEALPVVQLAAIRHKLNIRGTLHLPPNNRILASMLSDQVSEDLHTDVGEDSLASSFVVGHDTIADAISNQAFCLYYQPQIDLYSGQVTGFEGLMRWQHPQTGIKLPESFIHIAEQTGQIIDLTEVAIIHGFAFIGKLDAHLSIALNIHAQVLQETDLVAMLDRYCHQYDIQPARVILELTETSTMQDIKQAQHILSQLKERGFKLSIDDFGTGYSSTAQLTQLPFSELKIDKSFVTTMEFSSKSRKVVASTTKLADSLGMSCIAEGIENSIAAIGLRELGCRYGQGYYFARPMPESTAIAWLAAWNKQF